MFTSGLSEDIRIDVELQGPRDLEHALTLACAYEKKTMARPGARSGQYRPYQQPRPPPTPATALTDSPPTRIIRRLTPAEMAERHRQGLCFNCDEKFARGHKCAHLFFIEYECMTTRRPTCRVAKLSLATTSRASPYTRWLASRQPTRCACASSFKDRSSSP
jgi:hypothetical protein